MWPFNRKQPQQGMRQVLSFKDSIAFFEYQCEFGHTKITENMGIVAIVLDAQKEFGAQAAVKVEPNGRQLAIIRVASNDGGFVVPAHTPSNRGDRLNPGDIVIWVPMTYREEISVIMGDKRAGWIGMIRAKVAPEIDMAKDGFNLLCRFD